MIAPMVAALPLDVGPSATPHDPDGCLTEAQTSSTPDGTVPVKGSNEPAPAMTFCRKFLRIILTLSPVQTREF